MALEDLTGTGKFITSLVNTNPLASDDRREGDDHIRGIKNVLKNSFPNIDGAVTANAAALNSTVGNALLKTGGTMTGQLSLANVPIQITNAPAPNAGALNLLTTATEAQITGGQIGSGAALPVVLYGPSFTVKTGMTADSGLNVNGSAAIRNGALELGPASAVDASSFIDFKSAAEDYTYRFGFLATTTAVMRLWHSSGHAKLKIEGNNGGLANGDNITGATAGFNAIAFGWRSADSTLGLRIDATQFNNSWPINITGGAATATNATQLGGIAAAGYLQGDNCSVAGYASGNNMLPYMRFQSGATIRYLLWQEANDQSVRSAMLQGINAGVNAYYVVNGANGAHGVTMNYCDERVKKNIADSEVDGVAAVRAMRLIQFDDLTGKDHYSISFSAQNLKGIDANLASDYNELQDGTPVYMMPATQYVLAYAVKALQETLERIDDMEARLSALEGLAAGV